MATYNPNNTRAVLNKISDAESEFIWGGSYDASPETDKIVEAFAALKVMMTDMHKARTGAAGIYTGGTR